MPGQVGSPAVWLCVETEVRVPAFCLKWKTAWSFQERSPLSGGQAWALQSAELCRKGQAGQENILWRTRSFEEAAEQARGGAGRHMQGPGDRMGGMSSEGSQSICARGARGRWEWSLGSESPMNNSGSCLSNLSPGPLAGLDGTVRANEQRPHHAVSPP